MRKTGQWKIWDIMRCFQEKYWVTECLGLWSDTMRKIGQCIIWDNLR